MRQRRTAYPPIPLADIKTFITIVRRLRKECPWDREQTHQSIRHSLIEEVYEVVEALDTGNLEELKKELGDLFLHIAMHATMAEQSKEFTLRDLVREITKKLIRRHPHVFGTRTATSAHEVKHHRERLKLNEGRTSLLDGIPKHLPALQRASRVQERAARVGFDWKHRRGVWKKVQEETEELHRATRRRDKKKIEEELGDLLFAVVNYARFLDVEPETALRRTVEKFIQRFRHIEEELKKQGKDIHTSSLEEMDALWTEAKRRS
ncbi:MAG: nucleoside triphosphate pyrophosphohydrolase [Ignavibacteria bacterium]